MLFINSTKNNPQFTNITECKYNYFHQTSPARVADKALRYLNLVNDYQQYPAARCAMGANVYMYKRSASSVAESMNRATVAAREKVAVDPINALTLLIQMEVKHFNAKK